MLSAVVLGGAFFGGTIRAVRACPLIHCPPFYLSALLVMVKNALRGSLLSGRPAYDGQVVKVVIIVWLTRPAWHQRPGKHPNSVLGDCLLLLLSLLLPLTMHHMTKGQQT